MTGVEPTPQKPNSQEPAQMVPAAERIKVNVSPLNQEAMATAISKFLSLNPGAKEFSVGRGAGNDIQTSHTHWSGNHLKVTVLGDGTFRVAVLQVTNSTIIVPRAPDAFERTIPNNTEHVLQPKDGIRVSAGGFPLIFPDPAPKRVQDGHLLIHSLERTALSALEGAIVQHLSTTGTEFVLGRDTSVSISANHHFKKISREQVRIGRNGENYTITSLKQENPVWASNDQGRSWVLLKPGASYEVQGALQLALSGVAVFSLPPLEDPQNQATTPFQRRPEPRQELNERVIKEALAETGMLRIARGFEDKQEGKMATIVIPRGAGQYRPELQADLLAVVEAASVGLVFKKPGYTVSKYDTEVLVLNAGGKDVTPAKLKSCTISDGTISVGSSHSKISLPLPKREK